MFRVTMCPSSGETTIFMWHLVLVILEQVKVKVKQSHNRPSMAQRVPGGLGSQISMTFGTWRWWGCQPQAPAAQEMFLVFIFTKGWVNPRATVRSEGNISLKNPVTPPGIDPGTARLVVQCLNHYATPGPILEQVDSWKLQGGMS